MVTNNKYVQKQVQIGLALKRHGVLNKIRQINQLQLPTQKVQPEAESNPIIQPEVVVLISLSLREKLRLFFGTSMQLMAATQPFFYYCLICVLILARDCLNFYFIYRAPGYLQYCLLFLDYSALYLFIIWKKKYTIQPFWVILIYCYASQY